MEFQPIAITTTSDEKTVLQAIANHLIENRFAACVQISGPLTCWYRWEGTVQEIQEWQCLIKTDARHFESIRTAIQALHNYDEPQLVAFEITNGSAGYLKWIKENTD